MVGKRDSEPETILKRFHKALEAGDPEKAAARVGQLIELDEKRGKIDRDSARRLRLDLVTHMMKVATRGPSRDKVTLSLPTDVLRALRLASAESDKEMSELVSEALRKELKKYPHAMQALGK